MNKHDLAFKLQKQASVYCPFPVQVILSDDDQYFCDMIQHQGKIHLGKKTPYRYVRSLHPDGYDLFMEGLHFHAIAQLKYTDFALLKQCFDKAEILLSKVNETARLYLKKERSAKELKDLLGQYVYHVNLPLVLKAIEDGAVENAIGMQHPETWTALMFARNHISDALLQKQEDVDDTRFLMDKIIREIMLICTYGYRHHLHHSIVYLPVYLHRDFPAIRKLAIQGRLQSPTTAARLKIAQEILVLCQPIMHETVLEILDTIRQSQNFQGLSGSSLFSKTQSEISVNMQSTPNAAPGEKTTSKYTFDLSDEDFQRIEQMENQEEKQQQYRALQEIAKREQNRETQKEKTLSTSLKNSQIDEQIILFPLQRTSPTAYGQIALRTLNQSIQRSNKMARMLKREIMYASKNRTKNKLEYGRKLDQRNLYRAQIDGRVFYERTQGNKKDLCIYILVDNSESMSGDRIVYTMRGCYEVARVLQTLKIPFCISSHKAVGDSVQMSEIIPFQQCLRRNLLERIFYMHVSGGTHEEIALEKALKDLAQFKRHKKGFVFVLSDGETHGVDRIHDLVRIYKKEKDIDVIGIGIQTGKKIEETYPHGLSIQDMDTLPALLVAKLREIAL